MFSKQNLLPAVAAADKLIKTTNGYQLKVETTWYYQIQGQMALKGVKRTALVISTNKGIFIIIVLRHPRPGCQQQQRATVFSPSLPGPIRRPQCLSPSITFAGTSAFGCESGAFGSILILRKQKDGAMQCIVGK